MRRITKAALGGIASCTMILAGTQVANGDSPIITYPIYTADVVDLLRAEGPFDDAAATLRVMQAPDGTDFKLTITGIDTDYSGVVYGAHLHVGPCVEGDYGIPGSTAPADQPGMQALGHYNAGGGISEETEVWFELVPNDKGTVTYSTSVPFVPVDDDGIMSIVIHLQPTNETTGGAGMRQACIPLYVPQWDPTPVLPLSG